MLKNRLQEHSLGQNRQLSLKKGDIVYVAQGVIKKIGVPDEDIKHFIGPNDFLIIPPMKYAEVFVTLTAGQFLSLSEADFIQIMASHSYLLKPYQKLIMHWQRRRAIRGELLKQEKEKAKDLFPTYFKGIAQAISNRDKANYLSMSRSYYSTL
ncbi:hypothetical protein ORI89_06315 [Sphingobacterium sp. UT-1RO-CII-1]|uniref:hypothetical protein n=1 Tax=Sphingobacterium sp. UT-1RO-CII-1 TaxID=2995225 RepID=UPI00227CFE7B|nr:hypothetical protein [Sphingobacterium sp. UT-1RO-CII-1]MCY4779256.1 hypothetical protein [Sphingobacterium sp. UT-1RO-CII-1]